MYLPLDKFLELNRARYLVGETNQWKTDSQVPKEVITCTPSETVANVIQKLIDYKVHRIYVVNSHGVPLRVVNATSLFSSIAQ